MRANRVRVSMALRTVGAPPSASAMNENLAQDPASEQDFAVPFSYRPRKHADVLELDMGDGLILYNHDGDLVHHLNPSAGIVWALCDGSASVSEIGADIAETYSLDPDEVTAEAAAVIAEFQALGLVDDVRTGVTGGGPCS
jgi:hypothetical protein